MQNETCKCWSYALLSGLLEILNSKIDNFLGFEELSEDELRELDKIEAEMEKGAKFPLE